MKRKEFVTLLGVGAGAVVISSCLGACGKSKESPNPNPNPNPNPGSPLLVITSISTNADILSKGWTLQNNVIVAKTGANYIAFSGICPHAGSPMTFNPANNNFPCSLQGAGHGSIFNINGIKTQGPALSNLTKYNTSLQNDTLTVSA